MTFRTVISLLAHYKNTSLVCALPQNGSAHLPTFAEFREAVFLLLKTSVTARRHFRLTRSHQKLLEIGS